MFHQTVRYLVSLLKNIIFVGKISVLVLKRLHKSRGIPEMEMGEQSFQRLDHRLCPQEKQTRQSSVTVLQQSGKLDSGSWSQVESLKGGLQAHSMTITDMCTKYTIDLHQTETSHAEAVKICKRQKLEMRELEQNRERILLQMAGLLANRRALLSKVESTVQFSKALHEHMPRTQQSVDDAQKDSDAAQAELDFLGAAVDTLLADFEALNVKHNTELMQLRKEVRTERTNRVCQITEHNQKIGELESRKEEMQRQFCNEQASNGKRQAVINDVKEQILTLKDAFESLETQFKMKMAQEKAHLEHCNSRIQKHHEEIEKGSVIQNNYHNLVPMMQALQLELEKEKESLSVVQIEKVEMTKKLEMATGLMKTNKHKISEETQVMEQYMTSEEATRNNRAAILEKLELVQKVLVEKKTEETDLVENMQNLDETMMNIDAAKKELISKFDEAQHMIEKVVADKKAGEEQFVEAERMILDLEEEKNVIRAEMEQVEADSLIVIAEKEDIKSALNETRAQIDLIIAEKVELGEQVAAIDAVLENSGEEKTIIVRRLEAAEGEVQSALNDKLDAEEQLKSAEASIELLQSRVLELTTRFESAKEMIKSLEEEIAQAAEKVEMTNKFVETNSHSNENVTQLLDSAQLAIELGMAEKSAVKKELESFLELQENDYMELKNIDDELEITRAIALAAEDEAEVLRVVEIEVADEKEQKVKTLADKKEALDELSQPIEDLLTQLATFQQQNLADSKGIAAAEADFNAAAAEEQELNDKLKEEESVYVNAQALHETQMRSIAEDKHSALEEQHSLEDLEAKLEKGTAEHSKQKEEMTALNAKLKLLEETLAEKSTNGTKGGDLAVQNMLLKNKEKESQRELQEKMDVKAKGRSYIRIVSNKWMSEMAALKDHLTQQNKKIQELTLISHNIGTAKSPSGSTPKNKSPRAVTETSDVPTTSLEEAKSPAFLATKAKSPILSGFNGKLAALQAAKPEEPPAPRMKLPLNKEEISPFIQDFSRKKQKTKK